MVRNSDSENGLSLVTLGRLWVSTTLGPARSFLRSRERIAGPESACTAPGSRGRRTRPRTSRPPGRRLRVPRPSSRRSCGSNVDDRIRLGRYPSRRGTQIGDVPGPDLPGTGGFEHRCFPRTGVVAGFCGRDRTAGLIGDASCDTPPTAPRGQHDPVVPRGSERVIDGVPLRPARDDHLRDLPTVGGVDPRPVGPILLRHRMCHSVTRRWR